MKQSRKASKKQLRWHATDGLPENLKKTIKGYIPTKKSGWLLEHEDSIQRQVGEFIEWRHKGGPSQEEVKPPKGPSKIIETVLSFDNCKQRENNATVISDSTSLNPPVFTPTFVSPYTQPTSMAPVPVPATATTTTTTTTTIATNSDAVPISWFHDSSLSALSIDSSTIVTDPLTGSLFAFSTTALAASPESSPPPSLSPSPPTPPSFYPTATVAATQQSEQFSDGQAPVIVSLIKAAWLAAPQRYIPPNGLDLLLSDTQLTRTTLVTNFDTEGCTMVVAVYDINGVMYWVNNAHAAQCDLPKEAIVGRNIYHVIRQAGDPQQIQRFEEHLKLKPRKLIARTDVVPVPSPDTPDPIFGCIVSETMRIDNTRGEPVAFLYVQNFKQVSLTPEEYVTYFQRYTEPVIYRMQ